MNLDTIICPGCGWTGAIKELGKEYSQCPKCQYENGSEPYRLLTIKEMLKNTEPEYNDVRMDLFLKSVIKMIRKV